jgi:dephospho-CoA kinase
MSSKRKIGITGGIGAGKSVVSRLLRIMGYAVYDADTESKRLCNSYQPLKEKLIAAFGKDVYNERGLDKQRFAAVLFSDANRLKKANELIHPVVADNFLKWAERQDKDTVFVESAILNESILKDYVDSVILVSAPEELRIERAVKRDKASRSLIEARVRAQAAKEQIEKDGRTRVIVNDSEHLLIPQVEALF